MKLYSYIVKHDTGFSPNPFHGYCTLACCKPAIRRTAQKGDWVVGLTPKKDGNRIVYFMRVDENPLTFTQYWNDRRFKAKRPAEPTAYWQNAAITSTSRRAMGMNNCCPCTSLRTRRTTSTANMS